MHKPMTDTSTRLPTLIHISPASTSCSRDNVGVSTQVNMGAKNIGTAIATIAVLNNPTAVLPTITPSVTETFEDVTAKLMEST